MSIILLRYTIPSHIQTEACTLRKQTLQSSSHHPETKDQVFGAKEHIAPEHKTAVASTRDRHSCRLVTAILVVYFMTLFFVPLSLIRIF